MRLYYVASLMVALFSQVGFASVGDNKPEFQACLRSCVSTSCDPVNKKSISPLPLPLQLTLWSCTDNCKYNCMISLYEEMKRTINSSGVVQFYGKWPFYRVFGIQEVASFIFSIMNGKMHYDGLKKIHRQVALVDPLRNLYLGYSLISIHAWFWSAIFHARDTAFTERMDYFSAYSILVYSLYLTALRVFGLYHSRRAFLIWSTFCFCVYTYHVVRMLLHFDYVFNMISGIVVGVIHNLLWFGFSISNAVKRESNVSPVLWVPTQCSILLMLAMLFEVYDFPPYLGLIDAHSLWHLSTIFIIPKWYTFFCGDSRYGNHMLKSPRP